MAQPNIQPAATAAEKLRWNNNTCWIVLSYIGVLIHGLIGLSVVKEDDRVRFHCAQAVAMSIAFVLWQIVISILLAICAPHLAVGLVYGGGAGLVFWYIFAVLNALVSLAYLAFVIFIIVKAFGGTDFRVPFFADFADKHLVKLFNKK